MSRGSWAKRNEWEDKESYIFPIIGAYSTTSAAKKYLPLVGNNSELSFSLSRSKFLPSNSGRLLLLSFYTDAAVNPGSTEFALYDNNKSAEIASITIDVVSDTVYVLDFKNPDTGNNEFDGVGSMAISVDPDLSLDNQFFTALFEIDL